LVIYADAVLPRSIPFESFQPIAWWNPKVVERDGCIYVREFSQRNPQDSRI
jgi:hypothetical protein